MEKKTTKKTVKKPEVLPKPKMEKKELGFSPGEIYTDNKKTLIFINYIVQNTKHKTTPDTCNVEIITKSDNDSFYAQNISFDIESLARILSTQGFVKSTILV